MIMMKNIEKTGMVDDESQNVRKPQFWDEEESRVGVRQKPHKGVRTMSHKKEEGSGVIISIIIAAVTLIGTIGIYSAVAPMGNATPTTDEYAQSHSQIYIAHKDIHINATTWPIDWPNCSGSCLSLHDSARGPYIDDNQDISLWVDTNVSHTTNNYIFVIVRDLGDSVFNITWNFNPTNSTNVSEIKTLSTEWDYEGGVHTWDVIVNGHVANPHYSIELSPHSQVTVKIALQMYYSPHDYTAQIEFLEYLHEE